jgi:ABC-type polysaccharide/polyol phosphate transport system, ATPase component
MTEIEFNHVSKQYRLGVVSTRTLSHDLNRWWQTSVLRKEDPYLTIGEINDRSTKGASDYVWALKDIDFKVEQGDVLGIIGKNGAGKSTLLKILSKVTGPTTGTIKARGRIGSLLEVGTGFHQEMTGRENIYMNGAILGMTKAEITRKLDEIIDFSGCERYIDTPVKRYSSGMMVRLGFAVAAHLDPEILVVDEVLAVGDAEFQKKAIGKMQDVSKGEGRTVLFVSHNMTAVKNLCKTGIILKNGGLDFSGMIDQVIDKYLNDQIIKSNCQLSDLAFMGDGKLKIEDVRFLNQDDIETKLFKVGEYMKVEIRFVTEPSFDLLQHSVIDIGFNNMMDVRVMWISTSMFQNRIVQKNRVTFVIPELILMEGRYNINISCSSNGKEMCGIQNVKQFDVIFADYYKTGKIIPQNQGFFVPQYHIQKENEAFNN